MDFFTVPTLTFGTLYWFFVIGHDRRRILHFNVTRNPMLGQLYTPRTVTCRKEGSEPIVAHTVHRLVTTY